MKFSIFLFLLLSVLIGFISFYTSNSIVVGILIGCAYFASFMIVSIKKIAKYNERVKHSHECYGFINSFLITLSVKESLAEAFASATLNADKEFRSVLNELDDMDIMDKLVYLRRYFNLAIYKMFLNVLNIYMEQGGNILNIGETLMSETKRIEESINKSVSLSNKKLMEFVILWTLTFAIIGFIRLVLNDLYLSMLSSVFFFAVLLSFYFLALLSFHMFVSKYVSLVIKEDRFNG